MLLSCELLELNYPLSLFSIKLFKLVFLNKPIKPFKLFLNGFRRCKQTSWRNDPLYRYATRGDRRRGLLACSGLPSRDALTGVWRAPPPRQLRRNPLGDGGRGRAPSGPAFVGRFAYVRFCLRGTNALPRLRLRKRAFVFLGLMFISHA